MSVRKRFQRIISETPEVETIDALEIAMLIAGESIHSGAYIEPDLYRSQSVADLMDRPFGLCSAHNMEMEQYARPVFDMQEFCFASIPRTQEWLETAIYIA